MGYKNKRLVVSDAIKELLKKQSTFTIKEKERIVAQIEIEYGASSSLANEIINAFVKLELMKIER